MAPGASLNEIRSAYRRLAKKYHPDAAGERALPRFLAIQAAYELLVDSDGPAPTEPVTAAAPAVDRGGADAGRADAGRARASRDAWRARPLTVPERAGASEADGAGDPGTNAGASGAGRTRQTAGGSTKRSHAGG